MLKKGLPLFKLNEYVYPKVIPWQTIFDDIFAQGCTKEDLCQLLGVPVSSLWRWIQGTEPKESVGRCILIIHTRYCGEELTKERQKQAQPKERS